MPSAEIIEKALEQIRKRRANHDYFFSKLDSGEWIEPLDKAGLFSAPPPAVREGDSIRFPSWPESEYLARVASKAPVQVASVMMKIPETDNVRVQEDLAKAAAELPGALAAQWAWRQTTWVEQQEHLYSLLPESLGELISHLAASGELEVSVALARAVLAVRVVGDDHRSIASRMNTWDYEELLQRQFRQVLLKAPEEALSLLCDLLEAALTEDSKNDEDFSWIWRPAIEPHEQNHGPGDLRGALIDAIRDGAEEILSQGHDLRAIVRELLERKATVFKRIALHLAAECQSHAVTEELTCDRENFFDERLRHEYSRLLSVVFSELDDGSKALVLGWLEEGPSAQVKEESEDQVQKRKASWQAKRLFSIRNQLPNDWRQHYEQIVGEIGEPEHPDFLSYRRSWTGPSSPIDAPELEAMTTSDIALFLKSWESADELEAPTPEGLGRVLQSVVSKSPDRFVEGLHLFRDVDPTYARSLVRGVEEAVKKKCAIEWSPVVEYLAWIAEQPRDENREASDRLDCDPHWGWARKAAASLLAGGFEKDAIPLVLRQSAWRVVEGLTEDPDPTSEDDERATMDPATRSINTTRGEALHTVVQYALWIRRATLGDDAELPSSTFDMSAIPEVGRCLERHLDPSVDPSPATRAVFGRWFPWLELLHRQWVESRVDAIFPADSPVLRDAAWNTYLEFCRVYNDAFSVLRGQYGSAVDRLQTRGESTKPRGDHMADRLGEHLMVSLGRGLITWEDDDALLKKFFDNAPLAAGAHALAFVGHSLRNETNDVPNEVVGRFKAFWEELLSRVFQESAERGELLKPFGWWFASGRFDAQWALEHLDRVIEVVGGTDPDSAVVEQLAELSGEHPARCLEALKALIRSEGVSWRLLAWKDEASTVLQAALEDESSKADAKDFIHELGARGYFQFRQLLSG